MTLLNSFSVVNYKHSHTTSHAFTLFELLLGLTLLAGLLLFTTHMITRSLDYWSKVTQSWSKQELAHKALEQIALEIESLDPQTDDIQNTLTGIAFYTNGTSSFSYTVDKKNQCLIREENHFSETFLTDCDSIYISDDTLILNTTKGKALKRYFHRFKPLPYNKEQLSSSNA